MRRTLNWNWDFHIFFFILLLLFLGVCAVLCGEAHDKGTQVGGLVLEGGETGLELGIFLLEDDNEAPVLLLAIAALLAGLDGREVVVDAAVLELLDDTTGHVVRLLTVVMLLMDCRRLAATLGGLGHLGGCLGRCRLACCRAGRSGILHGVLLVEHALVVVFKHGCVVEIERVGLHVGAKEVLLAEIAHVDLGRRRNKRHVLRGVDVVVKRIKDGCIRIFN